MERLSLDISPTGLGMATMSAIDRAEMIIEARNHKYLAFISLTLVLWECIIGLKDEFRFIWRCSSRKTKALYLFARYFALGYMCVNLVISFKWTSMFPVPSSHCLRWYVQHSSAYFAQYVAAHITLLKRVLHLHRRRDVAFTFVVFHLAEVVGAFFSSKGTLTAMEFDPTCHALSVSKDVFLFLSFFVSGQIMIWSLIFRGVWKPDRPNCPPLDIRAKLYRVWHEGDGKAAWACSSVGLVFNAIYAYVHQRTEPTYMFGWPIAFLSIATCRYILSLEKDAFIRSRFSPPSNQGKQRATQPPGDVEDGIEITTTVNPVDPLNAMGRLVFARSSRSLSSVWDDEGLQVHPIGLHSLVTVTSSATRTELPPEVEPSTSPTNSIMSVGRRRSLATSRETRESEQTEITFPSGTNASLRSTSPDIEIGSMHTSSSITSEELRNFWNNTWNRVIYRAGSFIG